MSTDRSSDCDTSPATPGVLTSGTPSARPTAEALDPSAKQVVLLVNPSAGAGRSGQALKETEDRLANAGLLLTRAAGPEQLRDLTSQLAQDHQLRAVLAVGGDGTLGMALNHTPPGAPLASFPAGTENLLAKYLRYRTNPEEVEQLLTGGVTVRLDAGSANGRLFMLMISVGFDAEVVRRVHDRRRGNITHLAYAQPFLEAMRKYSYPPVHAAWEGPAGQQGEAVGRWLFGMNLPRYAQGLPIAPNANGLDGLLDLCVFERGHASSALWYVWHILRRRHHRLPSVRMQHCRRVDITSEDNVPIPYQLDGDPGGFLPVEVAAVPGRLTCVVQPAVARELGYDVP